MCVMAPRRPVVDKSNQPVPFGLDEFDTEWMADALAGRAVHDFDWGPGREAPRDAVDRALFKPSLEMGCLVSALLFVAFEALVSCVLLWGNSESWLSYVWIGLAWLVSLPLGLLGLSMNGMQALRGPGSFKGRVLNGFFALLLTVALGCALSWPILDRPGIQRTGLAAAVALVFLRFIVHARYSRLSKQFHEAHPHKVLRNRTPCEAAQGFYDLWVQFWFWQNISGSDHRNQRADACREEASQYLAAFRQAQAVSSLNKEGYKEYEWLVPGATRPERLSSACWDLSTHIFEKTKPGGSYGSIRLREMVFLRRAEQVDPKNRVIVYARLESRGTFYETEHPMSDWTVVVSKGEARDTQYDWRTLVRFEDGWFIEDGSYNDPPEEDLDSLRQAGLLS